jgi:hypothetical protein
VGWANEIVETTSINRNASNTDFIDEQLIGVGRNMALFRLNVAE